MFITDPHYKKLKKKEKKRREEKMWLSYALFFLRDQQNIELPKADEEVSKSKQIP